MRHLPKVSAIVLIAALAACNSQKEPATAAVKAARDAYNTLNAADMRYAAADAKAVRDSVENAEAALERAAYPLAIQEASGVPERVTKLAASIAARKTELTEAWTKAAAGIPPFLTAVTNRLKGGGGLSKADADKARAEMENITNAWTEAEVASQSGDVGTAAAKAADVKNALLAMGAKLKMKVPAELQ
jgi:hypothetical protein